ncbi:MAG: GGDEF domain-containing protein [Eubacterium sp.]|nr:GGDEF domain-containing protein [Eubacterium sp.]
MLNNKRLIALCTSRIYDPQIHGFIETLNEKLRSSNCASLLVFTINSDIYWDEDYISSETYVFDLLPFDELDCVIIMDEKIKSHTVTKRIISRSKDNNVPVIVVDGSYDDALCINFDYIKGFEQIVRHVIEEHHVKRPHMMAGLPNNFFSDQRIDIFKQVIAENGITFDDSMLSYGDFWADPTREAMKLILEREVLPDAIICANDIMAINVCDMLVNAGISIPDQVIVTGFDGYDEIFFSSPKISSVSCESFHLAEAAADAAIRLISGEKLCDILITPKLITNESCGCEEYVLPPQTLMSRFNNSFYRHQDDSRILYNITSDMMNSPTLYEMAANIHHHKTKHTLCIVDMNCFNRDKNYFTIPDIAEQKKDLHIIDDADYAEEHRFEKIPLSDELFYDTTVNTKETVLAGNYRDRIAQLCESGYPLIFNAIDYANIPIGFNCYFYNNYNITDFSRTASITSAISLGIGGFINMQYQRYLLNKMDIMYTHDALTNLYNRLGFQNIYDAEIKKPENEGKPITVIMSDLDGLKYINDNFGHAEGDKAIAAVACALMQACPKNALSARFGGDELFSVIIGECDPQSIINSIDNNLSNINRKSGLPYAINTSSGFYTDTLNTKYNVLRALKIADQKMYTAKNRKRNASKNAQ